MIKEKLDAAMIAAKLGEPPLRLHLYENIDSTNSEAKRYAVGGGAVPAVFLAEEQSAGRGRMGRSFFSPADTGIYLSLLLPVVGELADAVLLTSAAAVGVHRAIRRVTGIETKIKWVNDLYHQNRKVCGILAESFVCDDARYLVLGVGVNLYTEEFPAELMATAGGLHPAEAGLRNALAAAMIGELYALACDPDPDLWLDEYRRHSWVLGRQVTYVENGTARDGCAEAIDARGRLVVRHADGSRATLGGGEISLRRTDLVEKKEN